MGSNVRFNDLSKDGSRLKQQYIRASDGETVEREDGVRCGHPDRQREAAAASALRNASADSCRSIRARLRCRPGRARDSIACATG